MTTTLLPLVVRLAAFLTARIAVSPASASGATSSGARSWIRTNDRSEVRRTSAKPPSAVIPGNTRFSQCMSSPIRHGRHVPSVMTGCTMTFSPFLNEVTASPTSWTTPAFSWPKVYGRFTWTFSRQTPSTICRSVSDARTCHPNQNLARILDSRGFDINDFERLVVREKPSRLHATSYRAHSIWPLLRAQSRDANGIRFGSGRTRLRDDRRTALGPR